MPNDKQLFSKELAALRHRVQNARTEDQRFELMIKLAEQFVGDMSDMDENLDEKWQLLNARVIESRLAFEKHSLALARALLRSMPVAVLDDGSETEKRQADKSKAN